MALQPKRTWVLWLSGVVALGLVAGIVALDAAASPLLRFIRGGALLGYLGVFLASLSSLYLRELTRYFGRSFVKVHHAVAVTALLALALHAILVAWEVGSLAAFLPSFESVERFFALGGRPAFWFIAVASLTALFRTALRGSWRTLHWLNYLAFLLGTVHGQMIGGSFEYLGVRIVSWLMAVGLVGIFVIKRVREQQRKRRRPSAQK